MGLRHLVLKTRTREIGSERRNTTSGKQPQSKAAEDGQKQSRSHLHLVSSNPPHAPSGSYDQRHPTLPPPCRNETLHTTTHTHHHPPQSARTCAHAWQTFSKVSALVHFLSQTTIKRTFQNVCLPEPSPPAPSSVVSPCAAPRPPSPLPCRGAPLPALLYPRQWFLLPSPPWH